MKNSDAYDERLNAALKGTGFRQETVLLPKLRFCAEVRSARWPGREIRFLDYGCGPGRLTERFHEYLGAKSVYTGFDVDAASLAEARRLCGDRFRFLGAPERDSLAPGQFEIVFASGVFHHIPPAERTAVLNFLRELLAPDGAIVVWEHNPANPFTRWVVSKCAFDEDAVLIPPGELRGLFHRAGLQVVRRDYTTFFPGFLGPLLMLEKFLRGVPLGGQYVMLGQRAA